ncbi:hypothetical protein MY04_1123 [Flammeovirga sp. MY04]|uniref:hypothetical protein n=1 Tax=Flammeovirga sp. MY04 TaxID=1191459 RepID=UPI0008063741|nr:hypothetical protein [Flammeovirga sp. MY04]ANQ48500.1 hypothetical protein MY04_1123 [Flammeovirga sp. MY04]
MSQTVRLSNGVSYLVSSKSASITFGEDGSEKGFIKRHASNTSSFYNYLVSIPNNHRRYDIVFSADEVNGENHVGIANNKYVGRDVRIDQI